MTRASVEFTMLHVDAETYGSDAESVVSRAFFRLRLDGRLAGELAVDVRHSRRDTTLSDVKVTAPVDYDGPMNQRALGRCVLAYYRQVAGPELLRLSVSAPGAAEPRNRTIGALISYSFEIPDDARPRQHAPAGWGAGQERTLAS